jgi:hypothetical protein
MHGMEELYEDEKMKALEALLEKMQLLIAKGKGDKPLKPEEMAAEEASEDKPVEEGLDDGASSEEEASESGSEVGGEEVSGEKEASLPEMLKEYMSGGQKRPSLGGKSATIVVSSMKAKPVKKMKFK